MTSEERDTYIAEIRERERKATPGPWTLESDWCDCGGDWPCSHGEFPYAFRLPVPHTEHDGGEQHDYDFAYSEVGEFTMATADFIAHAREDVRKLLAIIDGLLASTDEKAGVRS